MGDLACGCGSAKIQFLKSIWNGMASHRTLCAGRERWMRYSFPDMNSQRAVAVFVLFNLIRGGPRRSDHP